MQLIDTHNHLYLPEFDHDRDEVASRSVDSGVIKIMLPNIDTASVKDMMETAGRYNGLCLPMIGLHPTSVNKEYRRELGEMQRLLSEFKFYGIGETGIDLYWDKTFRDEQIISFREHLSMAESTNLPVIIHSRESLDLVISELEMFGPEKINGVFHAFPGNKNGASRVVKMGFYLGIGGVITFRNSHTAEAAMEAGLDNIVLETDSPYLAPVPFRGKRNESAHLHYIVKKLSEIFSVDEETVCNITTRNAKKLFNIE